MSFWTDQWRSFIRETSYLHDLGEEKISNDQFWRGYGIYDQALKHSGYPGEVLNRIISFIKSGSTLLDIGAGTGAFAIPLSHLTTATVALDPSAYHLQILTGKAREEGLTNIAIIEKEWKDARPGEINELIEMNINCRNGRFDHHENGLLEKISRPEVDYALAAYSLFDEEIEGFLARMIKIAREGTFIVFRGSPPDSLSEFAYGPRPQANYLCLYNILKDMGHQFDVMLFPRDYHLPLEMVQKQYRFSNRKAEEIADHLRSEGRLHEREDGLWASFSSKDALLYLLR
ncbi:MULTISPECIES: class I SAM-dependent methyltransferase [Methanothrix]|jgi:SAM-dependent methyltransferase|uniref:Methyltransferase domain-containing protein n=2 Tax=root TaxID=1 RepID=F4BYY3_METSG|nr:MULTISPECIES: class I SAM-dependent methyltransferase [Methanothrix]AEB68930.1 conserved hypothetical protein [Methanothrix soehngenii GP6]MDD3550809.1 class I SAM-dependent methyltransferase [Methanothrix soehngenii]MDY0410791.1 class I SAM-dependent methyltransferase [Methanothrix soehngenii]UEC40520.1 MAG: hypothetical protein METHSR3v1_1270006 [Methanothrix sp.]HNQ51551.1 class I SAM-dependent methyltransferase [Methanothrix soehngenii]